MKTLVVSDNHGNLDVLEDLLYIYEGKIDLWLHCGDSEFIASDPIWKTFKTVKGNMDRNHTFPLSRVESGEEENLLVVHGHNHRVRSSFDLLTDLALENNAQVVFYGHTHVAKVDKVKGLYFINPGSITQPRGSLKVGTYAIYETNKEGRFISFYDWNHNEVSELSQKLN